jgi:hypothetical protein
MISAASLRNCPSQGRKPPAPRPERGHFSPSVDCDPTRRPCLLLFGWSGCPVSPGAVLYPISLTRCAAIAKLIEKYGSDLGGEVRDLAPILPVHPCLLVRGRIEMMMGIDHLGLGGRALGIFRPTRVLRMRSRTEGTISGVAVTASLPDRLGADRRLGRSRGGGR